MTVLAHAGHWLFQVIYLAPLVALVVILIVNQVRESRARRDAPPEVGAPGPPPRSAPPSHTD